MKKKIIILLSIFCLISISVVIINTIQDKILLEKHREFYNNYEELEYKDFKVKKLGVYEGYLVVFFDEMDKENYKHTILDYSYEGQLCLYKDGKYVKNLDLYNIFEKENTLDKVYVKFDVYKIFQYLLFENKV